MTVFTGTVVYRNYQSSFGRELHIRHIYVYVGRLPFTWAQFVPVTYCGRSGFIVAVKGGPGVQKSSSRVENQEKMNKQTQFNTVKHSQWVF